MSVPAAGCLIFAFAVLPTAAAPRIAPESCQASALREERLASVSPRGELALTSGARTILDGIHWPETEPEATQAAAHLAGLWGRGLAISQRGEVDRWGRARIDAVAEPVLETDEPADLATGLVAVGLAHADAGESDVFCRTDLIKLEAEPRRDRRGIWREPVLAAGDGPALATHAGTFIIAEGRIVGVGERAERTYLDFARHAADGLTVTVTKRTWRIMRERGLTAATLRGRLARVRGRLEVRRGPILEIVSADMIEVLEGERALTR
ncbi:hypothetical protein MGN01_10660 [Methylobacterium gnaphalii]|uniref:DNA-binding protein n=1 Tax=Methylobacterium gnaphalii TaxID=1010610 RepID=A0A512JGZ1_9HYPH|nr:DNA-binding protein [Methylobacterium gnaphalii]GEP09221.1 hypothetical protein MGN01_10660 [Methylobacterium gnaphalii]GLS49213.1 hypothetical protein GCM10007885_20610 [Methylobacterium gnaphalii]